MFDSSNVQPLITTAIGFIILGTTLVVFALLLLTRKSSLVLHGNYALILFAPLLIFILGTNFLAIKLSPWESLPYYGLLLLVMIVSHLILTRTGQTIVVLCINKKLIGDMFPLEQRSTVAHLKLNKWMKADQYTIESPFEKWEVTVIGRSAIMIAKADKKLTTARFKEMSQEIHKLNRDNFSGKGATIYLILGAVLFMLALSEFFMHRFLFP